MIRYSIDRPNIFLNVEEIESKAAKNDRLLELVTTIQGPGLIYFSSKKKADEIVEFLARKTEFAGCGLPCRFEFGRTGSQFSISLLKINWM